MDLDALERDARAVIAADDAWRAVVPKDYLREDGTQDPRAYERAEHKAYSARMKVIGDASMATDTARAVVPLITRLRAAEARTAWQPMETAPMTLDYILTHGPRGHVVARYCSALGWVDEDDRDVYFTHWQPLPAPPASEVPRD